MSGYDEDVLSQEEADRILAIPVTDEEVAELLELVRWFRRRYPLARDRFAYIRKKHREWTRSASGSPIR